MCVIRPTENIKFHENNFNTFLLCKLSFHSIDQIKKRANLLINYKVTITFGYILDVRNNKRNKVSSE